MHVARQDAGSILHAFAASELDVVYVEEQGLAAEFANRDLKRDAGPGGTFPKNQSPCFTLKGEGMTTRATQRLESQSQPEQTLNFPRG